MVLDGVIQYENLKKLNKDYSWLKGQVKKFGFNPEQALVVTIDADGQIYCQQKEGKNV